MRSTRSILPILSVGLAIGCSAPRNAAQYGWLRKQGEVTSPAPEPRARATALGYAVMAGPDMEATLSEVRTHTIVKATGARSSWVRRPPRSVVVLPDPHHFRDPITASEEPAAYYAEQPHHWNTKAIAALPVALATVLVGIVSQSILLLLIGGAVAFTLGLIGSRQCRDREDRGKGFAMAGMALGAAVLFFSLMVLIWAA